MPTAGSSFPPSRCQHMSAHAWAKPTSEYGKLHGSLLRGPELQECLHRKAHDMTLHQQHRVAGIAWNPPAGLSADTDWIPPALRVCDQLMAGPLRTASSPKTGCCKYCCCKQCSILMCWPHSLAACAGCVESTAGNPTWRQGHARAVTKAPHRPAHVRRHHQGRQAHDPRPRVKTAENTAQPPKQPSKTASSALAWPNASNRAASCPDNPHTMSRQTPHDPVPEGAAPLSSNKKRHVPSTSCCNSS